MPIELPDPLPNATSPPAGAFDVPVAGESAAAGSGARPSAPLPDVPRGRRPFSVGLGILGALVISLLAIGVLYYKWYKDRVEPNQPVIAVWGPDGSKPGEPTWAGAKVTVRSLTNPDSVSTGTLEEKDHVLLRFHAPPGISKVSVEKDGKLLAEAQGVLGSNVVWWPFRKPEAVTRPNLR
jgi:hypothetical protein